MGLFDTLFGAGLAPEGDNADRIWMTSQAKFAAIQAEVAATPRSDAAAILLIAHFPDVLQPLEQLATGTTSNIPVKAVLASHLTKELADGLGAAGTLHLIVAERHPLPSVDDDLEQFVRDIPCACRVSYHLSLDDAVIRAFAGDWMKDLLQKMGMRENEPIQSPMVSRKIRHAQQKIESQAFTDTEAESAQAWLQRNCPQLVAKDE
jgi:preprotein translocase subunit SecA